MAGELQVVCGAGPLGRAVTRALQRARNQVRMVTRRGRAAVADEIEVVAADATEPAAARRSARAPWSFTIAPQRPMPSGRGRFRH